MSLPTAPPPLGLRAGSAASPSPDLARRSLPLLAPAAVAGSLSALWLALGPRTPDLAAQVYRTALFLRHGFTVWDNQWYAGHHVPGYSLLFPPLAAVDGPRLVGALAAVASAVLFARLAYAHFGRRAWLGVAWFAAATVTDLIIGRLTFSLGVAVGLGAMYALSRNHRWLAALLSLLCTAASPVAGAFLALAGIAYALSERRWRAGATLAGPALALVAALGIAFPEGGRQPFSSSAFWSTVGFNALAAILLPRRERTLRIGAALYLLAAVAAELAHTPMGGNVSRLGVEFAGPLLVCAAWRAAPADVLGGLAQRLRGAARPATIGLLAAASVALAGYQWAGPVREGIKGYGDASLSASYYRPLLTFLSRHPTPVGRVEVPFTLAHWDATWLAERVPLARGWERQLDTKYDSLFYHGTLSPSAYRSWLESEGVRWVALPDVRLDNSSRSEGALLRSHLPYLHQVFHSAHWRVFELRQPPPLASGAAALTQLGSQDFALRIAHPGPVRVLVHFTPYWRITAGAGCVEQAPGGWTLVRAARPGALHVSADFSLDRVFDRGPRCTAGATA